jgi:6-phosphogluconolactonase
LRLIVAADAPGAAKTAAQEVARACRTAVAERGRALIAFSGGETPWLMLSALRDLDLPWGDVHVAQVDERIAPPGDTLRNLTRLTEILVRAGPLPANNPWPLPVNDEPVPAAAAGYQAALESAFGAPLRFDLVQLGLGTDGHTASLVPNDPVLEVADRDVALSEPYQGVPRMTLTFPALSRARERWWLVTGASKAARLPELLTGTGDTPAVRITRASTTVVADEAAASSTARSGSGE